MLILLFHTFFICYRKGSKWAFPIIFLLTN
nr:MAG TPA: hypothetical protein [Crassvirales sp.]